MASGPDRYRNLIVVALAAALAAAVVVLIIDRRDGPQPFEINVGEATPAGPMEVHITGAVAQPGVYEVADGSRVVDALFEAGEDFDIQGFGTEAQRLLRLEKGHLIVGHDTDALTDPYEAGLGATLSAKKAFFLGQRSLKILGKKERKRMLVGIRWPDEFAGPLPEECHLIVNGDQITGRVTSIARESTLGYPLGMAFVHPDFAEPGSEVAVRVERGALTRAVVTPLSHYDPENLRQSESPEGSA